MEDDAHPTVLCFDGAEGSRRDLADVDAAAGTHPQREAQKVNGEHFRMLFEDVPLMYFVLDAEGVVLSVNAYGARHLGYRQEELVGGSVLKVFHEADHAAVVEGLRTAAQHPGRVARWAFRKVRRDGSIIWVQEAARPVVNASGKTVLLIVCEDVTEQKQNEEKIARQREQLRSLASRMVLAEEQTRRQIARGLHDDIGQTLALARGQLGTFLKAVGSEAITQPLHGVCGLLDQAIAATRSLTFDLSSPVLWELGLEAALQSLGEQAEAQHRLRFHFSTERQPKPLADDSRVVIYRTARELLFNVVKHARARNVWMTVSRVEDHLQLILEDDGAGFSLSVLEDGFSRTSGFGLFSIRQQLEYIGGQLEIEADPGKGVRVTVVVPLDTAFAHELQGEINP